MHVCSICTICLHKCTFSKLVLRLFFTHGSLWVVLLFWEDLEYNKRGGGIFSIFLQTMWPFTHQFPHCNSLSCSHTHQSSSFLLVIHQCSCFLTHIFLLVVHYTCTSTRPYTPKPLHTLITVICSILTHSHTQTSPGKGPVLGSPAFSPPLWTKIASTLAHIKRFIPSGRKLWYSYIYFCCLSRQSFCGAPWQEDQYLS